jgi:hypothetical protein
MFGQSDSNDYQPFGYLGRIPLYLTTILVIGYVAVMVALALFQAGNLPDFVPFSITTAPPSGTTTRSGGSSPTPSSTAPPSGSPSKCTCSTPSAARSSGSSGAPPSGCSIISLVLLGPCLLTAASTFYPGFLRLAGSQTVNFAVFIAFCAIYPNVEIFFTFKAKWIAAVILGIDSLQLLAGHDTVDLLVFWATCLAAFLFIKYLRGHIRFSLRDFLSQRRSRRNLRSLPTPRPTILSKPPTPRDDVIESIDPLLDKIAKHGIGSLTPREREQLEQARAELLKKPAS